MPDCFDHLVDTDRGIISRELFVSDEVYRAELENLFARAWLFIGHESLIPNPGDFFTSRMGEESVILCRDRGGRVHVFLNTCRHRGMKVCRYDQGNTATFTCPYHAWSYGTDGALVGVPHYETLYEGVLDKAQWSLIEVPQLALYKGTVWASWDPKAPPFLDYLGGAREHLDQVLDCRDGRPGGSEVYGGVHKWIIPANWKFAAENFCGDTYHNPSHRSVDMVNIGPSAAAGGKGRRDDEYADAQHVWVNFPAGHGIHSALKPPDAPYIPAYRDHPAAEEYYRRCHEERQRRLGERARLLPFTGTIFPNASYHGRQPRALCVWHPHGPQATEVWRFFLVDRDAPAEAKDVMRRFALRYAGPAGMTEQDDMENWNYATAASRGTIARRYAYNYQQSIGRSRQGDPVPGNVAIQMTEENARNYYRRWADYVSGRSWDALLGRNA
jgi:phenylpropionate dioxygenase-like ring-hydroxylating dioxygenase large terminal subunit